MNNQTASRAKKKKKQKLPRGWTEKEIRDLAAYYDNQSEEERVAEHEAAYKAIDQSMIAVPIELVARVRRLIASRRRKSSTVRQQQAGLAGSSKRKLNRAAS